MKVMFRCGCGEHNYNFEDWISHFKYRGVWKGIRNLALTKIEISK